VSEPEKLHSPPFRPAVPQSGKMAMEFIRNKVKEEVDRRARIERLEEERRDLLRIIHALVMANGGELEVDFDRIRVAGAWDTKLEFYNDPKDRCVRIREVQT